MAWKVCKVLEDISPPATCLGFLSPELQPLRPLGLPLATGPELWRPGSSWGPLGLAKELIGGVVVTKAGVAHPGEGEGSAHGLGTPRKQSFPGPSDPG